jgi:hypothetical protein
VWACFARDSLRVEGKVGGVGTIAGVGGISRGRLELLARAKQPHRCHRRTVNATMM